MASVLRSILPLPSSRSEDHDEEYSVEYSFAIEYSGPPVSHDIPQLIPVNLRGIPTAAVADRDAVVSNLNLPVIQPIVRKGDRSRKNPKGEGKSGHGVSDSRFPVAESSESRSSGRIRSRNPGNCVQMEGTLGVEDRVGSVSNALGGAQSSSSSGTLGFSDGNDDSNQLSGSSDVEALEDDGRIGDSHVACSNPTGLDSSEEVEGEVTGRGNRTAVVTFCDLSGSDSTSTSKESDVDQPAVLPERPVVLDDRKKGTCHKCNKRNRFAEKEVCLVCAAKYCSKCVLRSMGSMPEGRKCITCTGSPINECKRGSLGKCSRMLKKLLGEDSVKQIMRSEISCEVNQLPPHLIYVNGKPLSMEELVTLQSCPKPPKKLRPGKYWYDKVAGFWGKDGEKPSQIISAHLAVGYQIMPNASNGNTSVVINNREITKSELWMLQAAGIPCEGCPHFWITADGTCQLEGMNCEMGKLWEKKRMRLICAALSLPFPSDPANSGGEDVEKDRGNINARDLEREMMNKFLLVGCDHSGTSTIYKQARILYGIPFSEDEKQDIKIIIQRNVYRYLAIILEARKHFEEDYAIKTKRKLVIDPGPSSSSVNSDLVDAKNIYSLSPRLEALASWLTQVNSSGNLEAIFPAATREYSPSVEELWKDKAFQAIYKRRNELDMLPAVANYFLDRAVEISRIDYEPSQMDILYAEGITSSNGVASMEFSFPQSSHDGYMESSDQNDHAGSYQLIRACANSLGENGKWLEMFEGVDLVIYCVSLTDYDEYYEDLNGECTNKMMATMKHFESIVTHPTFTDKDFLLILNKIDLLEDKLQYTPLTRCDWFQEFNPVISRHPHTASSNNNPSLAQRAFHFIAVKFKRLFTSLTDRKLFVSSVSGLEADSVDKALSYGKEILKWDYEGQTMYESSSDSIDPSQSTYDS